MNWSFFSLWNTLTCLWKYLLFWSSLWYQSNHFSLLFALLSVFFKTLDQYISLYSKCAPCLQHVVRFCFLVILSPFLLIDIHGMYFLIWLVYVYHFAICFLFVPSIFGFSFTLFFLFNYVFFFIFNFIFYIFYCLLINLWMAALGITVYIFTIVCLKWRVNYFM